MRISAAVAAVTETRSQLESSERARVRVTSVLAHMLLVFLGGAVWVSGDCGSVCVRAYVCVCVTVCVCV